MGSGGINKSIAKGQGITDQQLGIAGGANTRAAEQYEQYKRLTAPLITQQTALASGDRAAATEAAMPVISQLAGGYEGAKQGVLNQTPAGAGRDRALADLMTKTYSGIGGAQAAMVQQAPQVLAGLGGQSGQMSLQQLGAALGGLQGGAQSNQQILQSQVQQRAATLNFFGQLASAAGGVAGGALFGAAMKGGKAAAGAASPSIFKPGDFGGEYSS